MVNLENVFCPTWCWYRQWKVEWFKEIAEFRKGLFGKVVAVERTFLAPKAIERQSENLCLRIFSAGTLSAFKTSSIEPIQYWWYCDIPKIFIDLRKFLNVKENWRWSTNIRFISRCSRKCRGWSLMYYVSKLSCESWFWFYPHWWISTDPLEKTFSKLR